MVLLFNIRKPQKERLLASTAAIHGGEANEAVILLLPLSASLRYCIDSSNAFRQFVQIPEVV